MSPPTEVLSPNIYSYFLYVNLQFEIVILLSYVHLCCNPAVCDASLHLRPSDYSRQHQIPPVLARMSTDALG